MANNTSYIIWFNDNILENISKDNDFIQGYRPALDKSHNDAANFLHDTYGCALRPSCFSFESHSKYNLFLLRFSV